MKLLFICTHNACRSILSEVITRDIAGGRIETASAGSNPGSQVHPWTLKYLKSRGYSTEDLHSKNIDAVRPFDPDVVITVCDNAAKENCPVWLGEAIKVHWGLPDPSRQIATDDETEEAFSGVAATIESRIKELLKQPYETANPAQLAAIFAALGETL